jgi:hypothetical protein
VDVPRFPVPDECLRTATSVENHNLPLQKLHRVPRNGRALVAQFSVEFAAAARKLAGDEARFAETRGPVGCERAVCRAGHRVFGDAPPAKTWVRLTPACPTRFSLPL